MRRKLLTLDQQLFTPSNGVRSGSSNFPAPLSASQQQLPPEHTQNNIQEYRSDLKKLEGISILNQQKQTTPRSHCAPELRDSDTSMVQPTTNADSDLASLPHKFSSRTWTPAPNGHCQLIFPRCLTLATFAVSRSAVSCSEGTLILLEIPSQRRALTEKASSKERRPKRHFENHRSGASLLMTKLMGCFGIA
jgi:hypothetical protein